jgi:hypothetical protein
MRLTDPIGIACQSILAMNKARLILQGDLEGNLKGSRLLQTWFDTVRFPEQAELWNAVTISLLQPINDEETWIQVDGEKYTLKKVGGEIVLEVTSEPG